MTGSTAEKKSETVRNGNSWKSSNSPENSKNSQEQKKLDTGVASFSASSATAVGRTASVREGYKEETEESTAKNQAAQKSAEAVSDSPFELRLPPAPERPLDSDCCGEGCVPCVLDIYQQELELWEAECGRLRRGEPLPDSALGDSEDLSLNLTKYTLYTITNITQEATDIIRVRFRLPARQSLGLSIGQHIIIRFTEACGASTTRQYTPTSPLSAKGFFELMIKIYSDGRASQIIKTWKVGDCVEARGPLGQLSYKRNKYEQVLMLSAGTGVAPMCQVTHSILSDEEDDTRLRLVYAAHDYSCLMATEEMRDWRRYWNFSCLFLLSEEPENPTWRYKHGEEVIRGRLTAEVIRGELGSGSRRLDKILVLVCGTREFDSDMLECLREIGVPDANIHKF